MIKIIGILFVIGGVAFALWWVTTKGTHVKAVIAVCLIPVIAGTVLILSDRITEMTNEYLGTIKFASEQATADAQAIAEIKKRIEGQAATIDLVASEASEAKKLSEEVKFAIDFTLLASAARDDDREAFDKLQKIAEDENSKFSKAAQQAWIRIAEEHSQPFYTSGFALPWNKEIDPSKLSMEELIRAYQSAPERSRRGVLEYIWKRNDIPKLQRLDFFIEVMKSDSSLAAVEYAGRYIAEASGLKINYLAVDKYVEWWHEHRKEFEGQ